MPSLLLKSNKTITILIALMMVFLIRPHSVRAVNDPALFSCINPVGSIIASYDSGSHGIPGRVEEFTGSDRVYRIDDVYVLQCFCPPDGGSGIESNWWKVDSLSQSDIDFFVRRGWVHVPNGKMWGLDETPYLVRNQNFSCGVGGQVLGAATRGKILGASTLAATGDTSVLAVMWMIGISSAFIAYRISRV